jgi:hypothetical protein
MLVALATLLAALAAGRAGAVEVAVVDTGADVSVPTLAAHLAGTYDVRSGTADVADADGHGTLVASIAEANAGGAPLLIVRASATGTFTDADEAAGIRYAVAQGARIVNLSFAGPTTSQEERDAVQFAVDHGALVVAAAGNAYGLGNPVEYPAALLQPVGSNGAAGTGLAVAASVPGGGRAAYSATGSWISLAAPGLGGTSFAAAAVSGDAARVWSANPSLTAQQVAGILEQTASGNGRWTPSLGYGVVNVAAAVRRAQAGASMRSMAAPSARRRSSMRS